MFPEVQKDVSLGTIGIETIADGHLPREGVDRNDGARGVPPLREQRKQRNPQREE